MKKKKNVIIIVIILFIILVSVGTYFYKKNEFTYLVDCKIVETNDGKVTFKQTLGTFDPTEYGLDVYFIASPNIIKELNSLAESKDIDINDEIVLKFQYNELFDVKKEKGAVYFYIRKIINIEKSNFIPHL